MNHSFLSADQKLSMQNSRGFELSQSVVKEVNLHDIRRDALQGSQRSSAEPNPKTILIPKLPTIETKEVLIQTEAQRPTTIIRAKRTKPRYQSGIAAEGLQNQRSMVRDRAILVRSESDRRIQKKALERKLNAVRKHK